MPRGPIKCCDCGILIREPSPTQIRCHDCAIAKHKAYIKARKTSPEGRAYYRAYYLQHKDDIKRRKQAEEPSADKSQKAENPVKWDLKGKSGVRVEVEARALGISYGQYTSLISTGMIDRHCRALGIDGLKVIDRAWRDHLTFVREREKRLSEATNQ